MPVFAKYDGIDGESELSTSFGIVSTDEPRDDSDTLVFDLDGDTGLGGAKAEDAFFVKVDSETTTQTDTRDPDPGYTDTGGTAAGDTNLDGSFDFDDLL